MKQSTFDFASRLIPLCLIVGAVLTLTYSIYLSLTLYSYFIIGRDEANFLLRSSILIFSARDLHEAWTYLFQTHGQHVLLGMQLANLLSISIFGVIDFQFINLIGLSYLVIPAGIIVQRFMSSQNGKALLSFSIAAAVVLPLGLSPAHLSCAINTACTGNHYLGLGLSILALHLFIGSSQKPASSFRLLSAECVMALAILSSPAALALVPILLIPAWLHPQRGKTLLLHSGLSLLILKLYFTIALPADFSYLANSGLMDWLKLLLLFLLFCLQLLGSVFFWPENAMGSLLCLLLGAALLGSGLYQLYRRRDHLRQNADLLFMASGFLLLLAMVALIGLGRVGTPGSNRYIFYACFALIFLLCLWLADGARTQRQALAVALLCLASYPLQLGVNGAYIERIRGEIRSCDERWRREQQACGVMLKHSEATELLLEAERRGVLRLPR